MQVLTDEVRVDVPDLGDGAFGGIVTRDWRTCKERWDGMRVKVSAPTQQSGSQP